MTARTFTATLEPAGKATGVTVPDDIVDELGGGRPLVVISINGHSWRSRIASKNRRSLIGISRANRTAAGIELGQHIDVTLELDTGPRTVEIPNDVAQALEADPSVRAAFDALPYGLRHKHVKTSTPPKPTPPANVASTSWSRRSAESPHDTRACPGSLL